MENSVNFAPHLKNFKVKNAFLKGSLSQIFPPAAVLNLISLNPYQNRLKSLIYLNHLKNLLIYLNHRPGPPPPGGGVQVLNECFGFNMV